MSPLLFCWFAYLVGDLQLYLSIVTVDAYCFKNYCFRPSTVQIKIFLCSFLQFSYTVYTNRYYELCNFQKMFVKNIKYK